MDKDNFEEKKDIPQEILEEILANKEDNKIEENECEENTEIEEKVETEEKVKEEINKKTDNCKTKKIILTTAITAIILIFISTIFAILNIDNNNIMNGVYIEKVNVSNLNKEELVKNIEERIKNIEDVELTYGEYSTTLQLEDVGVVISSKEAMDKAIKIGKSSNIIIDNYNILKANIFKTKIELKIEIDEEKLKEAMVDIQAEMPNAIKEYSYEIRGNDLVIEKGKAGKSIILEKAKEEIIKNIKEKFNGNIYDVMIPIKNAEPQEIDIEKIYNEVHKEEQEAYIVEEPFELHKEVEGVDFDITIEEAKEILKENKEEYKIPLKITDAKVKVKDLGDKLFRQTLSKYTTIYDAGNVNRGSNIALAAKTINGTVLLPGETFSYNGILGNTTKEKGYKEGGAYVGGKVVQAYGGGICQVSSTIYNAVLYANLEIVERHNHSYAVSYVPAGRDATVSYGGKDFKFKNSRNYPIRIVSNAKNGVVSVTIEGIKEDTEYEVVLKSEVLSTTPCTTKYENNSNLEEGKQKVIQSGHNGLKSIAYKVIKHNEKIISKEVLSNDTYKPMEKIVQVGTKKSKEAITTVAPTVEKIDQEQSQQNNPEKIVDTQ